MKWTKITSQIRAEDDVGISGLSGFMACHEWCVPMSLTSPRWLLHWILTAVSAAKMLEDPLFEPGGAVDTKSSYHDNSVSAQAPGTLRNAPLEQATLSVFSQEWSLNQLHGYKPENG